MHVKTNKIWTRMYSSEKLNTKHMNEITSKTFISRKLGQYFLVIYFF